MLGLVLGGLWLAALWAWLGLHPGLHSDALYLPDLLQSLLAGRDLGGWDLAPAPSLFPDLGFTWLAHIVSDGLVEAQRAYGMIMGLSLWLVLAGFLKAWLDLPGSLARAHAGAGLLLGLVLLPPDTGLADWMLPGHHGAALLAALALWTWGLRQKALPSTWGRSLGLGALLGLLIHSDSVLWVWGCLPLGLLALRLKRSGRLRILALMVLAALVAWLAGLVLIETGARVAKLRLGFVFQRSASDWGAILRQAPGFLSRHGALVLVGIAAVALWASLSRRQGGPRVLLLGWLLATLASLGLATLLGAYSGRYLYLLLWLPALLLPALAAGRGETWERPALLLPALAALLWMAAPPRAAGGPLEPRRAEALDALLAPRGLRYGWADYWQARPLRLLSRQGILCAPMISTAGRVDPYLWIGERGLFMQGDMLTRPQFVVVNGLDAAALQSRWGTPPEIATAQDLTVWLLVRDSRGSRP